MAKGDHGRMQNEIGDQKNLTRYGYQQPAGFASVNSSNPKVNRLLQNNPSLGGGMQMGQQPGIGGMENLFNNLYGANSTFMNNYNTGVNKNLQSYDDIMAAYQGFMGGNANLSSAAGGFRNFADTGGFSDQDIQNIRARAIAPTRSIYSNAMDEVNRNRSLQGYSPNHNAALAKMSREQSYNISDINTNANAAIAQMVQQGKLAGLSGLANVGSAEGQLGLGALGGMTSLYGSSPGLAATFGNQVLNSGNQLLGAQGMQNDLAQMFMNARAQNAQIPGNFQQAMGNIGSVLGLGGRVAGSLIGLGGFGAPASGFSQIGY